MVFLSIDTSCDETSVGVTDGAKVLSNAISSQIRYHKKYGGVVPFLAQRLHEARIGAVVDIAIQRSGLSWKDIDAVAVTYGPGLAPALQVGVAKAKELAAERSLPLYAINHMAGHIASCFAQVGSRPRNIELPALALLASGKHTELATFERFGSFTVLGETLDDAIGEAYDKVGRMVGLGYPGGGLLAKFAEDGDPKAYALPVPMVKSGNLNFSYSGLKNAVRLLLMDIKNGTDRPLTRKELADVCASFQEVAQASVMIKLEKALKDSPETKTLLLGGGVASNMVLRAKVRALAKKYGVAVWFPADSKLCRDNGAMIGVAAHLGVQEGLQPVDPAGLDRVPALRLE